MEYYNHLLALVPQFDGQDIICKSYGFGFRLESGQYISGFSFSKTTEIYTVVLGDRVLHKRGGGKEGFVNSIKSIIEATQ